jgi:hypothetical protein
MKTTKTHTEALAIARQWIVERDGEPGYLSPTQRDQWYMLFGYLADFLNELYFPKPKPADAPAQLPDAYSHLEQPAQPNTIEEPSKKASDEGYKFVDWFLALLAETEAPKIEVTEATRNRWADCYDKMIRIDQRTKEQVVLVCKFGRHDPFWRQNFFSPSKLRDKKDDVMLFDKFLAKATTDTTFTPGRPKAGPDIYSEPPNWREAWKTKFPDTAVPESWASLSSTIRNALLEK